MSKTMRVKVRDRWFTVEVVDLTHTPVSVLVDGDPVEVDLEGLGAIDVTPEAVKSDPAALPAEKSPSRPTRPTPEVRPAPTRSPGPPSATKTFSSPMPGVILSVAVKIGDQVVTGDPICVLEAMKMQQVLRADWTGIVRAVHVESGQQVLDGDPIVELE